MEPISEMLSLSFFIDKRIKAKTFKNDSYYPLYVRLYFSGNNTTKKVTDPGGESIMMTMKNFDQFIKYYQSDSFLDWSSLVHSDAIFILDREQLYRKVFEHFYRKYGDNFDFKKYAQNLKFSEKYLDQVLRDSFEGLIMELAKKRARTLYEFNSLNINSLYQSSGPENNKWHDLVLSKDLPEEVVIAGRSWIAWRFALSCLFQWKGELFDSKITNRVPTYRATVFSWNHGTDRDFFMKVNEGDQKKREISNFFEGLAKKIFTPDYQELSAYVKYIDSKT